MTILFILLGILFISAGFSCIFTPLLSFMQYGYFVVILMTVFGVIDMIKAIVEKRFGINFVFGILSVILGGVMLAYPESLIAAESVMLTIAAVWIVLMGAVTIVTSLSVTKAMGSKHWIFQLIFGIIGVLIGGYSLANPMLLAISVGVLIGIFFIETGFTLMFGGIAARD